MQVVANGTDQTAQINQALALGVVYGARKTVKLTGDFVISGSLVLHSHTTLDATDATIILGDGANSNMIRTASTLGTGPRTIRAHIRGGFWNRRDVGSDPNDASTRHSILFHRADNVSVQDVRFNASGEVKYSVYFVDCNHVRGERIDMTSTSDGVHITGPCSDVTLRDITGDTHDDLVSFTGNDYPNYNLTVGGGDLTDLTVERVHLRSGKGNAVKLLPGQGRTLARATVRGVSGNPDFSLVTVFEDPHQVETTGGTVEDVLIEDVSGTSLIDRQMVDVRHPNVKNITIRNISISQPDLRRAVCFTGDIGHAIVESVTTSVPFSGAVVAVNTDTTVDTLQLGNIAVAHTGTGGSDGSVVYLNGTVNRLQLSNVDQTAGFATVYINEAADGAGACPFVSVSGWHSTAAWGVLVVAPVAVEVHASRVTALPVNALAYAYVAGASVTLRGSQLKQVTTPYIARRAPETQTIRAIGAEIRADVATLTAQVGDIVYNTNAALPCGVGPVVRVSTGSGWRSLLRSGVHQTAILDFPPIAAGGIAELTAAIAGAQVGDLVTAVPAGPLPTGLIWSSYISAVNTVSLRVANMTGSAIDPTERTWRFAVDAP